MWQSSLLAVFAGCLGGETAGCSAGGPDCIRPARNVLRLPLPLPLAPGPQRCPRPLGANSGREHNKNLSRTKSIPSGYVNIAIENGDRNSGFTHWKWWIFPVRYVSHYQRVATATLLPCCHAFCWCVGPQDGAWRSSGLGIGESFGIAVDVSLQGWPCHGSNSWGILILSYCRFILYGHTGSQIAG